jgi:biotin operon repressor
MNDLLFLSFAEARQPEYREKKGEGGGYIEFGQKNDYPNYLVELLNKSAKHNSIIKSKVNYITGNGFKTKGVDPIGEQFIQQVNPYESLAEISRKVSLDIETFGGAYLNCIWSESGEVLASIYHLDYTKVRTNADNTQFWYCEDWNDRKYKKDVYNAFNTQLRQGSQVMYLKEYRPSLNAYALPGYYGALNYIESDIEISKHVLGNAQTGFSASKLITLPNGEATDDEKRNIERKFTSRFSGSDGKKFILSFVNDLSRKTVVDDLGASDITKEDFQNVDKLIQQNIYAGHQITSPDLFGISTPGQLGSRQQMRDSYEIFKNTYVNDKQIFIEQVFSELAKLHGAVEPLEIIPVEPIGFEFSEQAILAVAPKEWILEKLGIDMSKYQPQIPTETPQPTAQTKHKFSEDEVIKIFSEFGEDKERYSIYKSRNVFDDADNFEFAVNDISQLEANILDQIQKQKQISVEVIASTLKIEPKMVETVIKNLEKKGILSSKEVKGTIERTLVKPLSKLNAPKPTTTSFQVRYSYEWRQEIPTSERNTSAHPSRPFCARLMSLNRLYTRSEIQTISGRLGYSVFDRRGGWWTMPNGDHSPSCRHVWYAQTVIKRD